MHLQGTRLRLDHPGQHLQVAALVHTGALTLDTGSAEHLAAHGTPLASTSCVCVHAQAQLVLLPLDMASLVSPARAMQAKLRAPEGCEGQPVVHKCVQRRRAALQQGEQRVWQRVDHPCQHFEVADFAGTCNMVWVTTVLQRPAAAPT